MTLPRTISLLLLVPLLLGACSQGPRGVVIENAWAEGAPAGENTAVYLLIDNHGGLDYLEGASTEVAQKAAVHQTVLDDRGNTSQEARPHLEIPAHDQLPFKPGGLHVLLIGLNQALRDGDRFNLTLHFVANGQVEVRVDVEAP